MEGLSGRGGRSGAPDDPDVEAARDAIEQLQVATGRARLYGDSHPQTRAAMQLAQQRLGRLLDEVGAVTLATSPDGLFWRGKRITEDKDDRVGIGRHVHVEGISHVTFSPGISLEEIEAFAGALRVNLSLPQHEEETLESLLWQAELRNIGFRAIAELMEAEAASGRDEDPVRGLIAARRMVELQEGDIVAGRKLREALDPRTRGGDVVDQWELDAEIDLERVEDDEWRERFVLEAGEDAAAILAMSDQVRTERSSQLLARTVMIVLHAAVAGRPEVPPPVAERMVADAMRQMYQIGDPVGVLDVLERGHKLAEQYREASPSATQWVREQLRRVYSPLRVARMLRLLDPSDPVERPVLDRFLGILPDTAVLALFDGIARDEDPQRLRPLARHVLGVARPRVSAWLAEGDRIPADQLVPIVNMVRIGADEVFEPFRAKLLRHTAAPVREAVLDWYRTSLPEADAKLVAAMLVDPAPPVREAALRALAAHRPPEAVRLLHRTLEGEAFAQLDPDRKTDLCTAYGRLAGPTGLTVLTQLLNSRTGLLRNDAALATVSAAAMGLAAMGTANALLTLEKAAKGLPGAKKSAAQIAIGVIEAQRAAEGGGDG
ncbi:MAG: hypothetical protein H6698_02875 [Myxococcales bacterium]|nr:hypothetical protein [Myxococcales bacterium]MCB9519517.1 hypothetical protein [Myxococcales bacterium]MCB9533258.1 hypothetical protein [Myxococcales bacterium]